MHLQTLKSRGVKAGKVNCDEQQWLCQEAGIRAYPTVRFYEGTTEDGFGQVRLIILKAGCTDDKSL